MDRRFSATTRISCFGTTVLTGIAVALSWPARSLAAQEVLWVGTLGTDTMVVEASRRTPFRISGTVVNVGMGLLVQRYEADLEAGRVTAFRSWSVKDLDAQPSLDEPPSIAIEFGRDSIRLMTRGRNGPDTTVIAGADGAVPVFDAFFNNPMALMDHALRRARDRGEKVIRLYYIGGKQVEELALEQSDSGGEGGEISYPYIMGRQYDMLAGARLRARLDDEGLSRFDATETTFKIVTRREPWRNPLVLARSYRDRGLGAGGFSTMSPPQAVSGRIGDLEVAISYGQPSRRGRTIFPDVVPFGEVWRAGANAATRIQFSADALVGGVRVPAASYSVWVIPGERTDTLILNKAARVWGTMYNPAQDLLRVPLSRTRPEQPIEALRFAVTDGGGGHGRLELGWGDRLFSVAIDVPPPARRD